MLRGETIDFVEDEFINIDTQVNVFKGIPYAETPVRFRPPEPKGKWNGTLDALSYTYSCSQYETIDLGDTFEYGEDCLFLNVYAPNNMTEYLPVMVFIHGGGYTTGSSMAHNYDGIPLAAVGHVVMVTINYRLGALGFLDTGDDASPGNFGLLDQVEALRWIRRNIRAFGGDNSSITIFGESAGAGSVDFHVTSKLSRDLFDQAILESGTAVTPWSYQDYYEQNKVNEAFRLGGLLNCTTTDTQQLVECLRQVDDMLIEKTVSLNTIRMGPTIDGVFLDESPITMTERGDFKHCPMIVGFNRDEGTLLMPYIFPDLVLSKEAPFIDKATFNQLVIEGLKLYNPFVPKILEDAVKQEYVDWSQWDNDTYDFFDTINYMFGDEPFSCPSLKTARAHATMTSEPVFLYFMTQVPTWSVFEMNGTGPGWLGAGHGEELQFVFGYPFIPQMRFAHGPMTNEEKELCVTFMKFWTNFAKSGNPSREDSSSSPGVGDWAWPEFTVPGLQYKELAVEMSVGQGIRADECAFWNDFKVQLLTTLATMDQAELQWREEFSAWQTDLEQWRMSFNEYQQEPYCEN
ncbi:Acetylcholinesterase [Holothuria leucospilota]|uniref:Carboxylic ester hydrolase n=1 Tax=Holothuria leucospilota TaxID=206669 RepID=A0A9Q1C106_HOLLE|nr:Acetylcholinesterase [Holothuria leucospilota]